MNGLSIIPLRIRFYLGEKKLFLHVRIRAFIIRWLDGFTYSMDMNLGKLQPLVRERETWCVWSPWSHEESDMTWWLKNKISLVDVGLAFRKISVHIQPSMRGCIFLQFFCGRLFSEDDHSRISTLTWSLYNMTLILLTLRCGACLFLFNWAGLWLQWAWY